MRLQLLKLAFDLLAEALLVGRTQGLAAPHVRIGRAQAPAAHKLHRCGDHPVRRAVFTAPKEARHQDDVLAGQQARYLHVVLEEARRLAPVVPVDRHAVVRYAAGDDRLLPVRRHQAAVLADLHGRESEVPRLALLATREHPREHVGGALLEALRLVRVDPEGRHRGRQDIDLNFTGADRRRATIRTLEWDHDRDLCELAADAAGEVLVVCDGALVPVHRGHGAAAYDLAADEEVERWREERLRVRVDAAARRRFPGLQEARPEVVNHAALQH
mmetsp:Transcript_41414/g.131725  ORF Transcript_41414/g.131725 Transcript_41414/m.131725 type:complete len:273 (-) Transcript_41414:1084-1902(-)